MDTNGDMKIEKGEFISAFIKMNPHLTKDVAVKEATCLFDAADMDKNGFISFQEWCASGITMK